jgi:uncharacterized membrane protein (DUF4010 family)
VVGAGFVALVLWRARRSGPDCPEDASTPESEQNHVHNPLGLRQAVQMALLFQVVLLAIGWVQESVGREGVVISAAIIGLTDVDALTLSMARLGTNESLRRVAATAIAVGVLSNTLVKLVLTVTMGSRPFQRRASIGLLALSAASGAGLALGWWLW